MRHRPQPPEPPVTACAVGVEAVVGAAVAGVMVGAAVAADAELDGDGAAAAVPEVTVAGVVLAPTAAVAAL
jgi:hypothetical protein